MAERLLAAEFSRLGLELGVESAGIAALSGFPADPIAIDLMEERGLDISAHRARQLTADILRPELPLILVMEGSQVRDVRRQWRVGRQFVRRLGEWGEFDIADPYQGSREDFETALERIEQGVHEWAARLARPAIG